MYQKHLRLIDASAKDIRNCKPMDEQPVGPEFVGSFLANTIDVNITRFMVRSNKYDLIGGIPPYQNLILADFEIWINASANRYKATAFEETFALRLHESITVRSSDVKFKNTLENWYRF